MGKGLKQLNRSGGELNSLTANELRVLHLLQITRRPLQSHELEGALGIAPSAVHAARDGLADRGFIARTEQKQSADGTFASFWSLAE